MVYFASWSLLLNERALRDPSQARWDLLPSPNWPTMDTLKQQAALSHDVIDGQPTTTLDE